MRILQICNAFDTNSMYKDMFLSIKKNNHTQVVVNQSFVKDGCEHFDEIDIFYYKRKKNPIFRLLWRKKIKSVKKFIESNIDIDAIDIIHAHNLFSDGSVAYSLHRTYHKPYIVAIRNTDVNVFFKYFVFDRKLGYQILLSASKIVLISHSYAQIIKDTLPAKIYDKISNKIIIVPNGIKQEWFENKLKLSTKCLNTIRVAFVGDFVPNKNIDGLFKACSILRSKYDIKLTAIGLKQDQTSKYINKIKLLELQNEWFEIKQRMNIPELIQYYQNHVDIFAMVSFKETFGLVYIEALLQGLPVLYSRNQGIDGYFEEGHVGFHADANDVNDIALSLEKIIVNYDIISKSIQHMEYTQFEWDNIAKYYSDCYNSIVK